MFYTIYKITNIINNKIYIGKHKTKNLDDDYMGSGKLLNSSISKYGIENFKKEILHIFDNEKEMNDKEAELVTNEFINEDTNYNLCPGGNGGFGYIRNHEDYKRWQKSGALAGAKSNQENKDLSFMKEYSKNVVEARKKKYELNGGLWYKAAASFKGKRHSKETKEKIGTANSKHQTGEANSQFGSIWITNGTENKKIKKESVIPEGWYKGRTLG